MAKDRENIPVASTLMGSLRSMGYSFESAVADVIDNSISAHATFVKVLFPTNPFEPIAVGILDDGEGMSDEKLFEAMRYGSMASEAERDEDDLGRFGMGMKAASLSQCRNLTVVSYSKGKRSAYTWDYDYIQKKQKWIIQELTSQEIDRLPYVSQITKQAKGTLVIWRDFDVLSKSSDGQVYETLVDLMTSLDKALALIFHRFLSATGSAKLKIQINNQGVKPLDPFLECHPKTSSKKERTIAINDSEGVERLIHVKPFVLPFATDLSDNDKKLIGGIENLRAKQGFYVYRNNRLIIWGTWFGMKQRAELTKNARRVAESAQKNKKVGRIVVIKVRYSDFSTLTKRMTLDKSTQDFDTIERIAHTIFDQLEENNSGVRLLGVTLTGLEDQEGRQLDLDDLESI